MLVLLVSLNFHCGDWIFCGEKILYPKNIPNIIRLRVKIEESLKLFLRLDFLPLKILRIKIKIPS